MKVSNLFLSASVPPILIISFATIPDSGKSSSFINAHLSFCETIAADKKSISPLQDISTSRETLATQYLQGLIMGIDADNKIEDTEIKGLQKWLYENDYL